MGIKHLRKIEKIMQSEPDKLFKQGDFTNYYNIEFYETGRCLQYLWEHKLITTPVDGKYKWKK